LHGISGVDFSKCAEFELGAFFISQIRSTKGTPMSDQKIVNQALRILEARLYKPDFFVTKPDDAKNYLKLKLGELEHETFNIMFLNSKHGLISLTQLFRGTIDNASVPVREVVKDTLKVNAAAVILSHNHPSGSPDPSMSDKRLTEVLTQALNLVGVRVLDHIIVGGNQTYSLAEHGDIEPSQCKNDL